MGNTSIKVTAVAVAMAAAPFFLSLAQESTEGQASRVIRPPKAGAGISPVGVREAKEGEAELRLSFPEVTGRHVLIVSASKLAGEDLLDAACRQLMTMLRLPVKCAFREFGGTGAELAQMELAEPDVVAVVAVVDDSGAPSMVAMPEQKMVVINPMAWCPPGTDEELARRRVFKMVQRGFCAVLGATVAPVFSVTDLDALRGGIAPSALQSVFRYGKALGLERVSPIVEHEQNNGSQADKAPAAQAATSAPAQ